MTPVNGLSSRAAIQAHLPERIRTVCFATAIASEAKSTLSIKTTALSEWLGRILTPFTLPATYGLQRQAETRYIWRELEIARSIPNGDYNLEDAAKILGITVETLHAYLKDGTIRPTHKSSHVSELTANALRKFKIDRLYLPL